MNTKAVIKTPATEPMALTKNTRPAPERGIAVIRVNNRGHDIVSRSTRPSGGYVGAAFETMEECHLDWDAWCSFAAKRGAERVILWGHSLGAVKNVLYCARTPAAEIAAVIASSPPRFSYSQFARNEEEWPSFEAHYAKALRLVDAGQGDRLITVEKPTPLLIAARTFVEKYGPDESYDYVRHIPNVTIPLLITIGSKEGVEKRLGLSRLVTMRTPASVRRYVQRFLSSSRRRGLTPAPP